LSINVLIVGAGIAGQTLACALAKRAIACDVVEIKPNFEILGAGMYVQNNALRALLDIGITQEIVERGWHAHDDTSLVADMDGNVLTAITIPKIPGFNLPGTNPIARQVLHEILHDATVAAGVQIKMGVTVKRIVESVSKEKVEIAFTDGSEQAYDLVVGADGIRSKVREFIHGDVSPEYSGFSNWRAVLPRPTTIDRAIWQFAPGKSCGVIPISDSRLYIAGVSKEPGNPRYERSQLLDLMRERFMPFGGPVHEQLSQIESPDQVVYTPIEEVGLPRPWSKGRVVVLGDAAHASTPFWAQGGSMAIEDAVLLAQMLTEADTPITTILKQWETRRFDRCIYVQEGSRNAGIRGHHEGDGALEEIYKYIRTSVAADTARRYERLSEPI
jgi:2-polyprenyl-6-methoxyphenol hydroxylase-like FAD-dependent oxidoreductase